MDLKLRLKDYCVTSPKKLKLKKWPTQIKPLYDSTEHYRKLLAEYRLEIIHFQNLLYAHSRYSLLLIFQGMDAAGKDGVIKHVMSGVNPQGCQVFSFKQPSEEELNHDFLWRTHKCLPERGRIGIFNRSYYEEVLIARVDSEVLKNQKIPAEMIRPKKIWNERFKDIINTEDYLRRNGTHVIKFFLHLSKEEQRKRFLERIDDAEKNWKLTRADIDVRRQWKAFQAAYEDCLGSTSRPGAPWYVIPADDKKNARLLVSQIIVETMKALKMHYPQATQKHRQELIRIRHLLERGKK